jgi:hypothetical protein
VGVCTVTLEFGEIARDGEEQGKAGLVYRNEGFIADRERCVRIVQI